MAWKKKEKKRACRSTLTKVLQYYRINFIGPSNQGQQCSNISRWFQSRHSFESGQKYKKSNLHYTRGITPKLVTGGGTHLRDLSPGQHCSEETSQRWRVVGDTVRFDQQGIESIPSAPVAMC